VFVFNDHRQAVWHGCASFFDVIRPISELDTAYVDGGFVTNNDLPKDVDVVLELANIATLFRVLSVHPHLFDQGAIKTQYLVDLWFALVQMPLGVNDLRLFFQYLRPEDATRRGLPVGFKKGILRVSLQS
jgi:hypothetical protein